MVDHRPSVELLESTHLFPGVYRIKAIGFAADDFQGRVVDAVVAEVAGPSELDYSVRTTPGGRHVADDRDVGEVLRRAHETALWPGEPKRPQRRCRRPPMLPSAPDGGKGTGVDGRYG